MLFFELQYLTMDMGGSTSTTDFVQAVIRHMYEV